MKAVARPMTERDLREQVRTLCKLFGWRMAFTQYSIRSPKGFPDLVLCRPPRLILAELKSDVGKTTQQQDEWLADLRVVAAATEIEVYVWRPADVDDIARVLGGARMPSS